MATVNPANAIYDNIIFTGTNTTSIWVDDMTAVAQKGKKVTRTPTGNVEYDKLVKEYEKLFRQYEELQRTTYPCEMVKAMLTRMFKTFETNIKLDKNLSIFDLDEIVASEAFKIAHQKVNEDLVP